MGQSNTPAVMRWIGFVLSAIVVLMMGVMGLVMLFFGQKTVAEGMAKHGYPAGVGTKLLIVEIVCAVLYAIPRTAVLVGDSADRISRWGGGNACARGGSVVLSGDHGDCRVAGVVVS